MYFFYLLSSQTLLIIDEETTTQKSYRSHLGSRSLLVEDLRLELKYPNSDYPMSMIWLCLPKEEHMFVANCFRVVRESHRITHIFLHSAPTLTR